jgi:hypothetical protein
LPEYRTDTSWIKCFLERYTDVYIVKNIEYLWEFDKIRVRNIYGANMNRVEEDKMWIGQGLQKSRWM